MAKHLISFIGVYDREIAALVIAVIVILSFRFAHKKYTEIERKLIDNHVKEIYDEMERELLDNIEEDDLEGPIIDLELKMGDYCNKKNIEKKLREKITKSLNEYLDSKNSELKKHLIYMDGNIMAYIKLKEPEEPLEPVIQDDN